MKEGFQHEHERKAEILAKLSAAGERSWQRYPLPWQHPSFKSCTVAAQRLLDGFQDAWTFLVMRDACLRPVRDAVLARGKALVIPVRGSTRLVLVPGKAPGCPAGTRLGLEGSDMAPTVPVAFTGTVGVVVVSCLAFSRHERRLYSFELEKTAWLLDELRQGREDGWRLPDGVPIVCIAADQQEVTGWPESAMGLYEADMVVTQSRTILLGTGEEVDVPSGRTRSGRLFFDN
jgi:hypothetical protein